MTEEDQLETHPSPSWAKLTGRIFLKRLTRVPTSNESLDRLLIAERVYRYGWAYDERDRDLFTDCFTEDAVWEGNVMGIEPVGPFVGRQAVVDFNCDFWPRQEDQRRHVFTNVTVDELTETTAVAHAYLLLTSAANSKMTPVTTGPYRLELIKTDGWKINHLCSSFDAPF